jgi:hypothetical protein
MIEFRRDTTERQSDKSDAQAPAPRTRKADVLDDIVASRKERLQLLQTLSLAAAELQSKQLALEERKHTDMLAIRSEELQSQMALAELELKKQQAQLELKRIELQLLHAYRL